MDIEIRPITEDEYEEWARPIPRAFGQPDVDAASIPVYRATVEFDRSLAALDAGRIVGGALAYSWEMTVPGGSAPLADVDAVAVLPTHRRRGILTRLMERQLRDVHERGEPLAALTASESSIYGRFGYGIAAHTEDWEIGREQTAFAIPVEVPGRVVFVEKDEARKLFPGIYDRVRSERIGMTGLQDYWWDPYFADLPEWRRGHSAAFYIVYEEDGLPLGYAVYRLKEGTLSVQELVAATDEAYAALWSYCFGVDLISSIRARRRATDEPLPWMLAAPRKLERKVRDHVWLRLVNVAEALAARRYDQEDSLVLDVEDSFCEWNEGRFELVGGPDGAECRTSNKKPDLALSAADLAATYLGGVRFTTLASAGRVEELTPGAAQRADAMFTTPHQPWTPRIA